MISLIPNRLLSWLRVSVLCGGMGFIGDAAAQLRIVDYNTATGPRTGMDTILAAIGAESINGVSKAPDVFSLQEQTVSSTQQIVALLNTLYGAGTYAYSTVVGGTTGAGTPGLIYNTQTVQLIASTTASTTSSSGAARQTMRYELRPVGYDEAADFYVYSSHYKSSDTSSDRARRAAEAAQVRSNADALGQGAHIIYTGDFNIYSSSEAMWTTLTGAGAGQALDPISRTNWTGSANKDVHTQSPAKAGSGLVTGGMDDRFDFQLVTAEFLDNEGLSYMTGSYHAFGNTGTHAYDGDITTGSATALQAKLPGYTTARATAVLNALATVSDHLPVVAQYQLPAKMGVSVGTVPRRMILGANASVAVTVSNVAPVLIEDGADELDYTITGSGGATGSQMGTDKALGTGNTHEVILDASTVGDKTGGISVISDSQQAADKNFSANVTYSVLDHAQPIFAGMPEGMSLTLNFGTVAQFSGLQTMEFSLENAVSMLGASAGLDLDQVLRSLGGLTFSTDLQSFLNLAAGDVRVFRMTMATDTPGVFEEIFTLKFSDENIAGATDLDSLTLKVMGEVVAVPEPGTTTLIILGLAVGYTMIWRSRRQERHEPTEI